METWKDPIVEEIRAVRDAYAKRFDFDVHAICQDLQRRQEEEKRKIVNPAAQQHTELNSHSEN